MDLYVNWLPLVIKLVACNKTTVHINHDIHNRILVWSTNNCFKGLYTCNLFHHPMQAVDQLCMNVMLCYDVGYAQERHFRESVLGYHYLIILIRK